MNTIQEIYEKWHEYAKGRDTEALISLYAEDAIFESPLVPAILDTTNGALKGKTAIRHFLEEGTKRRPNELVKWFRTGEYLTNGDILMWEYPRITDNGEQIDILEVMEIEEGLIHKHRIYWGWKGCMMLSSTLSKLLK
ncbi:nuclear transport factor 2 family protein [Streptococcus oralis]|uniref:Nuclear transport factor 2 family protein n=1 Tax=Streptococcus oralis TaxID=1303 RepID=A0A7T2ZMH3_STROR|nr:nuclear transport factor 2 family protein [Streptococcus oralis]QPS96976.1 nuclear transport factor 2 family protein [Streptococcus oralis]